MSKSSNVTRRTAIRIAIGGAAAIATDATRARGPGTGDIERVEGIGGNPIQLWQPSGSDRG